MIHIGIDESGSLTSERAASNPYQVFALVKTPDVKMITKLMNDYVLDNRAELKKEDKRNVIFEKNDFLEFKGCALSAERKKHILRYLCNSKCIEVYFVVIKNKYLYDSPYTDKLSITNDALTSAISAFLKNDLLPLGKYSLLIDEQNLKPKHKRLLGDNIKMTAAKLKKDSYAFSVNYIDSRSNKLVQIADIFANVYYTYLVQGGYTIFLQELREEGVVKAEYQMRTKSQLVFC